jgi:hypothetical protein
LWLAGGVTGLPEALPERSPRKDRRSKPPGFLRWSGPDFCVIGIAALALSLVDRH